MTDNVKITDEQNVGIVNEKGDFISNAGSASDVAANYPTLKTEIEAALIEYNKENVPVILDSKFSIDGLTVIIETKINGQSIVVVEGTEGGDWAALYKTEDINSPIKFEVEDKITMVRFYAENKFGKSEMSDEFSLK